ncbi:Fungal Zn(2)-Cys(6) binuclear cluster domain-containing protein [Penicillium ucsense]|uniref:Fungal Zn(2)-Cys(6) binuclear cluster domain-containing protein n=1 Tax=Penicillium ucsense TaxID=2839758 RepID=A0A8J8WLK4_9EURO|nr:Fungal Zn(2)-Cys(6) binuclear cluster domain-containing protein [Penicillium ucsense]KAF7737169.1 Fungal Zn(2)-Cys(6) binuclear cluster domain-containing protein [Penicillium ucsense]
MPPRKRAEAGPSERSTYPRKRAVQACQTCRQKRIKCDNEQPACGSCVSLRIECHYREHDRSTFDPASIAILQRLEVLENLIRTTNPVLLETRSPAFEGASSETPYNSDLLGSPALERMGSAVPYQINIENILKWPVFQSHSRGRTWTSETTTCAEPQLLSISPDFDQKESMELLQRFFRYVHIYNPILEVEKVQDYARNLAFNGLAWDAKSCLLLLIYALAIISGPISEVVLASSSAEFRRSESFLRAEAYFLAAQKRMGLLLCRSGMVEAQCLFFGGVYLMMTLRPLEAWRVFVQALACSEGPFNLWGTHSTQVEEKSSLQESIYWTCFKSELELRLELNVAKNNSLDLTYPVLFPSPPRTLAAQGHIEWYFYLSDIALRRLGNRILNYIYRLKPLESPVSKEAIRGFEAQATGLLESLPSSLNLDTASNDVTDRDDRNSALSFILNGHLLDCYEMMYWPFVVDALHGNLVPDKDWEEFALKGFRVCVRRIEKNEGGFYYRHHGTWLMLRSCTRSALVLTAAARHGLTTLLPAKWRAAVEKVTQMLQYWKDETKDVADSLDVLTGLMKEIVNETSTCGF